MMHAGSTLAPEHFAELLDLLTRTPDLVAVFDADDRLQMANPAYCQSYNCDPSGRPLWRDIMWANYENARGPVIETSDIEAWLTIACARRSTVPYRSFEAGLHGGKWIWVTETVSPGGSMLFHASEISTVRGGSRHLRLERDAARRASWTDALTGVPNRRYVMDRLEEWIDLQRIQPDFGTHTLAVIDLDNFKQINDRHGHDQGDTVLVGFCREVVRMLKPFDLFGRIGGEEFLLLMPTCSLETGRHRLELLQQATGKSGLLAPQPDMPCSFSAGIVAVGRDEDIHDAIRRADRLVYQAKADGRACVRGEI